MKWNFKILGLITLAMFAIILLGVLVGGLNGWTILVLAAVIGVGGGKVYVALR